MNKEATNNITTNEFIEDLKSFRKLNELISNMHQCIKCGTIDYADAAAQINMLKQKEYQLKEKLISQVHVTKDGTPRKIEYNEISGLWKTMLPDKKRLFGKTKEILLDKLMEEYGLYVTDLKFETVFNRAIEHKDRTEAVNEDTLH